MTATISHLPTDTSRELESDLLSALIWADPATRNELLHLVHTADYLTGGNSTLHEVIAYLHRQGLDRLDNNAIIDELERRNHLSAVGGSVAVVDITSRHISNGRDIAARIVERSQRRQISARASRLHDEALELARDPSSIVHRAAADLLAISRRREGGIVTATDTADELRELAKNGPADGWRSGWTDFDVLYRPRPGQLSVITGIPSHGKSTWIDAYILRLAEKHHSTAEPFRIAFFSPERETAKHQMRLISTAIRTPERQIGVDRIEDGITWLSDRFFWLDDQSDATLDSILARARLVDDRHGISGLVIDPWNWVEAGRPAAVTETEWIGLCLNELVRLAQQRDVHVWVVAHPTKVRQIESGDMTGAYQIPRPYDIASSANWFNKPWFCLSVWRDHLAVPFGHADHNPNRDSALVDVHVQKVRDDDLGRVGTATFKFRTETREYLPVEKRFGV